MGMNRFISLNTCFDTKSYIQKRLTVTDEITQNEFTEFIHGNKTGKPYSLFSIKIIEQKAII